MAHVSAQSVNESPLVRAQRTYSDRTQPVPSIAECAERARRCFDGPLRPGEARMWMTPALSVAFDPDTGGNYGHQSAELCLAKRYDDDVIVDVRLWLGLYTALCTSPSDPYLPTGWQILAHGITSPDEDRGNYCCLHGGPCTIVGQSSIATPDLVGLRLINEGSAGAWAELDAFHDSLI